jgi:hypothetical protein
MSTDKFFVYLKGLIIIPASGFLFGEKIVELFQETILTPWIVFTVSIILLAILSLYQKREAIKTLIYIEDRRTGLGSVLFTLSILTYISSAYFMEGSLNILLAGSLSLFLASLITLTFNYRIPRELSIIFVAVSLVFLPSRNYEGWALTTRVLAYAIATFISALLVLIIVESFRRKKEEICPLCSSKSQDRDFCPYCGRKISVRVRHEYKKSGVLPVIFVLFIILVMNSISVPALYLSSQKGCLVELYTVHGKKYEPSIRLPDDYVLISSERLDEYERQTSEDLALLKKYQKEENILSVFLEVGAKEPYFMDSWKLPGWDYQKFMENVPITETTWGKCYVLRREENSLVVLRTITLTLTFKGDLLFTSKKAGTSVFINFSYPIDDIEISSALNLLRKTCTLVVNHLFFTNEWTNKLYTLSQVYDYFKDYLLTAVAVSALLFFAGWSRYNDHLQEKIVDKVFSSSTEKMKLLMAILRLKKRKFTGRQLFEFYATKEDEQAVEDLVARMEELENKGLLRRDLAIRRSELKTVWVSIL